MKRRRMVAALAALVIGACDGAADGGSDGRDVVAAGDGADVGAGPGVEGPTTLEGLDLTGTWAQLTVESAIATLPVVGEQTGTTTGVFLLAVVQNGTALEMRATVCALEIDNGTELVETIVPDAFLASLQVQERVGRLEQTPSGVYRVVQDEYVEVRGATLTDPGLDALPTAPDDARVVDQDGDGKPGVTLRIGGLVDGEVYVVQRGRTTLLGNRLSADRIDGLAEWSDEQSILGADNDLLLAERDKRPDAPEKSWFRATRVPDGMDCAAILADRDALFAR